MKIKLLLLGTFAMILFACGDKKKVVKSDVSTTTTEVNDSAKEAADAVKEAADAVKEAAANVVAGAKNSNLVEVEKDFKWQIDRFADLKIVRYQIPGWEQLTAQQRLYVYYLTQSGLAGREIIYDQNYRHNIEIKKILEHIYTNYPGDKSMQWEKFKTYVKRFWFSNGIHHHYANTKFDPGFPREYMTTLAKATGIEIRPEIMEVIFDPKIDAKKVELDSKKGLVEGSAVNFYEPGITTKEAHDYFESIIEKGSRSPLSYGLNSRLIRKADGSIGEEVYKIGGKYGAALKEVVKWLTKAIAVAENDKQKAALRNLIKFYETGDLKVWDTFNINWVKETEGDIDFIHGFVEVYNDPLGYTGSFETVIEIKDFEASQRMDVFMENIGWFEKNSPFMEQHKKKDVKGVIYNVVNVAGESGDSSPSTPIGVNLPNANWIRVTHGSKSVSLGNIVDAYSKAGGSSILNEFANDAEEIALAKKYGDVEDKIHTALHEVVGHASGQIEPGVGTPKETIKNYASTLEEGRADLVALYFMLDKKLIELGLMESLDCGKAAYDSYIRNGLLTQLRRLNLGDNIEEAHMRNRAWITHWVLEKGKKENVIAEIHRDGKTYYDITDYNKLHDLFGELLREVQRIKSQGDYDAAKALVENYGVSVDQKIHKEVLDRTAKLNTAPYGGFVNPLLLPIKDEYGNTYDVRVEYPDSFEEQMLYYMKNYSTLSK